MILKGYLVDKCVDNTSPWKSLEQKLCYGDCVCETYNAAQETHSNNQAIPTELLRNNCTRVENMILGEMNNAFTLNVNAFTRDLHSRALHV
jgi:hypothetical protein